MADRHKETSRKTPELGIVLKGDSFGSLEAVAQALSGITLPNVDFSIIHSGVGAVSKSDVLLAETASRLIVGFQVDVLPSLDKVLREHRVEVRLYDVIYKLTDDIKAIAENMTPPSLQEQIIGFAKVIALFKSTKKGIIIGCEVQEGFLSVGQHFRIISVMGPVYSGTVESLHIGEKAIQKATPKQQVGIKIKNFSKAKIGDLVESYKPLPQKARIWYPRGEIIKK